MMEKQEVILYEEIGGGFSLTFYTKFVLTLGLAQKVLIFSRGDTLTGTKSNIGHDLCKSVLEIPGVEQVTISEHQFTVKRLGAWTRQEIWPVVSEAVKSALSPWHSCVSFKRVEPINEPITL